MALNGGSGAPSKLDRGFASSATSDPAVAKACAAGGFLETNPTNHGCSLSGVDSNDCAAKTTLVAREGSETDMSFAASCARFSLKSVLVATDFSDASRKPVDHALAVARHYGAKFYLAHVVSGLAYTLAGPQAVELASEAAQRDLLQLEHDLVENGSLDGIDHESLVRKGVVWEELQSIISQNQIDLVVVGTHGRHGLGRTLLGSVAENVFRHANCPVLTVGPNSHPFDFGRRGPKFLFATDFGEGSRRALPHAISLANHVRAKLTLLHVVPVTSVPEDPSRDVLLKRDAARMAYLRRLEQLLTDERELVEPPEYLVQFGLPSEKILQAATQLEANLIFIGLRHSVHIVTPPHMHWATAYEVVCGASCPVLTVRTQ
jgi:nucleotide-binding universal stress UspA family protein